MNSGYVRNIELLENEVKSAVKTLRAGGVILYPTDTVWGIGCDANNYEAVKRVFEIKKRAETKSMIVLVSSVDMLNNYVHSIPKSALRYIEKSNNPLTIIYPEAKNLSNNLIASDGSVAIRVTNEIFSNKLCREFDGAVVSTSANISGKNTPMIFEQIEDEILSKIDYIPKYRRDDLHVAKPSTIVKLNRDSSIEIIRE